MKTHNHLYPEICSFANVWASWGGHAAQAEGIGLVAGFRRFLPPPVAKGKAGGDQQRAARRLVEQHHLQRDSRQPQQQQPVEHQHQQRAALCEGDPAPAALSGGMWQNGPGSAPGQRPSRKPTPPGPAEVNAPGPNRQGTAGPEAAPARGERSAVSRPQSGGFSGADECDCGMMRPNSTQTRL
jgi:hypothetical protein